MEIKPKELLAQLVDLLPADVWWGDGITPSMLVDILDKYAAARQEPAQEDDAMQWKAGYSQGFNAGKWAASRQEQPVPDDPTGEMWSAGRTAFLHYAKQFEDSSTSEGASLIADIAGAAIYRAMIAAQQKEPT